MVSYKNMHSLTIANKYGSASSIAKAELYETYDRLRDLTVSSWLHPVAALALRVDFYGN